MSKTSFDQALDNLKDISEKIKSPDINLEESIKCYEEGLKYYDICNEILKQAKQKVEIFEQEDKSL